MKFQLFRDFNPKHPNFVGPWCSPGVDVLPPLLGGNGVSALVGALGRLGHGLGKRVQGLDGVEQNEDCLVDVVGQLVPGGRQQLVIDRGESCKT